MPTLHGAQIGTHAEGTGKALGRGGTQDALILGQGRAQDGVRPLQPALLDRHAGQPALQVNELILSAGLGDLHHADQLQQERLGPRGVAGHRLHLGQALVQLDHRRVLIAQELLALRLRRTQEVARAVEVGHVEVGGAQVEQDARAVPPGVGLLLRIARHPVDDRVHRLQRARIDLLAPVQVAGALDEDGQVAQQLRAR